MDEPAAPKLYSIHDDGHELRLQRLEAGQQTMTGQLATVTAKVEAVDKSVQASTSLIMAHIDSVVKPQAQRLSDHIAADGVVAARVDTVEEKVAAHHEQLHSLEDRSARRQARWDAFKKGLWAILIAGGGVGAKELVVFIARHM